MKCTLRLLAVAAALGANVPAQAQSSPSAYTSGTRYDVNGRVTGTIAPDPDGAGALGYAAVRTTYDVGGRPIKVETGELANWQSEAVVPASWSGFTVLSSVETSYDALDRKLTERTRGSDGIAVSLVQYSYDAAGRLECMAQRMNPATYGSLPASACSLGTEGSFGSDRITRNLYDAAGRLLKVQKAYGTPLQEDYATYTYSLNGKQTSLTDARGYRAEMTYDGQDRQARWYFPSPTTTGVASTTDYEEYGYDANGNRTSLRKRDGSTITYQYDALNRNTVKIVPERSGLATTHTRDVYYGYDLRGLQTYARFDSASGEGMTTTYDGFGRMTSSALKMDGVTRSLSYASDKNGNRIRVTHPDGVYYTMTYDGLDRMANANWWAPASGSVPFVAITYNARGMRSTINRASSYTDYGFDPLGRPNLVSQRFAGGMGNVATNFTYTPASQIAQQTRDNDAYAWTGHYNVDRSYTANGLNQYTAAGAASFTYDANGNLTSDGSTTYVYDIENRLVSASGAKNATLRYDPLGRLYEVVGGGNTTRMLYDGDQLAAEYNSSGMMLRRYFWGPNVDEPIMWDEGTVMNCSGGRFLHPDHQGSIIAVADCNGNQVAINAYDEYGIPKASNLGRFQYTGQAWLPEIGMYYYKARIYSPTLGRFLQTDPIGYDDQVNLYAYVANDPVNGKDPTGQRCVTANADSVYCLRRDIYRVFDSSAGGKTRFFGAAAATVEYLANNDIPLLGNVISDQAEGFLKNVSASLYSMNAKTYAGIMDGSISSRNLDAKLVHMEQTRVQSMIDALPEGDRTSIIGSINSAFAGRLRSWSGALSESDARYNRVLDGVVKGLGRSIDFGNQGDREAIGNALIKDLRSSGACTQTGSRIPTC